MPEIKTRQHQGNPVLNTAQQQMQRSFVRTRQKQTLHTVFVYDTERVEIVLNNEDVIREIIARIQEKAGKRGRCLGDMVFFIQERVSMSK